MATKIILTITPDTNFLAPDQIDAAMLHTVRALQQIGAAPLRKFVLNFECKDDDAEDVEDTDDQGAPCDARYAGAGNADG